MTDGYPGAPPPQQPHQPPAGYQPPQQPGGYQPQQPGYQQPQFQQPHHQQAPGAPQQPGGYYQQGPPPSPAKKGPSAAKVLLAIFLGLVVLIGGCSAAVFLSTKGEIDRANEFLAALQTEDYATAEAMVNPTCGASMEELIAFFSPQTITAYRLNGFSSQTGQPTAATGTITFNGNDERIIAVTVKDDLVCGVDVGSAGQTEFGG